MAKIQTESLWVANPMTKHLMAEGWKVWNITPGFNIMGGRKVATMEGWPDCYISKRGYLSRWVEWKVVRNNQISFTPAQKIRFPELLNAGVMVYIICSDSPLVKELIKRKALYAKILGKPNGDLMRQRNTWRHLF